ncbi:AMP-binding protein [Candidatus Soleaferrea massiliensis]|uniref:AMP-binding protein n=1 Tax=Candidatus Soleaferrea massiliensis TaxID=1470354 RepID=UPI000590A5B7|nr:AMP-binding protein [Candidatus Soleaferrea massiliensis]
MLLDRFLPRIEFDSYEDFKENYQVNVPEDFNFGFDIVDAWAKEDENKMALVWCDDHGGEKKLTFADIMRLSNQTVHFFKSIGIRKGSVVMLILRRRWEYWICATALHKLGAVLIPGSLQLTKKDIVYRSNAAGIETVICVNDAFVIEQVERAVQETDRIKNRVMVQDHREGWLNFEDEIAKFPQVFERPSGDEATRWDDTMLIYFTSGTTGMPKMVRHNYSYPLGHIVTAKYWQQVQENKLHMSVSDSGWAKFGWGKIYGQWICGAVIFAYDMDKFIPLKLLQILEKYRVTTFCAPPTMFRFMLQEDVTRFDLSSIQHCCIAGEPLNPEVFKRWYELTGLKLYEGFGQTESSVMLANFQWFDPVPGSTGKPSPLYNIQLIDEKDELCEDGDEGRIVVMDIDQQMPTGLFVGYYQNEELTQATLGGRYYDTGDVAWRDSNGYYWFVGRSDDVIKCSGYRIGPFEVESALIEHPAVVECAITASPDPIRGQVVKATIVLAAGYTGSDALKKELQNHVKKATAPYKYPRIIEFVDELPKTLGGKIKRAQIRHEDSK